MFTPLYSNHGPIFIIMKSSKIYCSPEMKQSSPKHGWRTTKCSWWRHQMETFSALLAICAGNSPVPGEFPTQRPVPWSFDIYFDLRLNKRLCKQSWGWWFETLLYPLWRHSNVDGSKKVYIIANTMQGLDINGAHAVGNCRGTFFTITVSGHCVSL